MMYTDCLMAALLPAAVAVVLAVSLAAQVFGAWRRGGDDSGARIFSLRLIATCMGLFLATGMLLFMYVLGTIASEHSGVHISNVEYLLRSLICSLDLFMLDVDSNILDRLDSHSGLKAVITVQAVMSFACTVALLAGMVYSRLRSYVRLRYRTRIDDARNHLYLFFGINRPTELLIADIARRDPAAVTVLIDEADLNDDSSDGWDGIVGLMTHKRRTYDLAARTGARICVASRQPADIDPATASKPGLDMLGYLGLGRIRRLIGRLRGINGARLHIFFMDDDEERNIRNIIALAKDPTISAVAADPAVSHRIYCHARRNGPNRVIEDVALRRRLDIRIIDSSHIAVELLKHTPRLHPAEVARFSTENPATVERGLDTLIVGFGEVGRDAFRFLYEFGTLVADDATATHARRAPFRCTIVDRGLDTLAGAFRASMPAIFGPEAPAGADIDFMAIDHNQSEFFDTVLSETRARTLNYVVVSTGDDDEAIALAARIFTRVRQVRDEIGDPRILVRCTDDAKAERLGKIADHYNHGYGLGRANRRVIEIFGLPCCTYTYDLVVGDRLERAGHRFHAGYRRLSGVADTWHARRAAPADTGTPDLDLLSRLRRQESQDMANASHAATKLRLLCRSLPAGTSRRDFLRRYFGPDGLPRCQGAGTQIRYTGLSEAENLVVLRLAQLEHLRWVAAHELLGYSPDPEACGCDERRRVHSCICAWHELDGKGPDFKRYDFGVVDTSLAIAAGIGPQESR